MEIGWLIILAAGVLLVRVGQTLSAMGLSRAKNVGSSGFRSVADLCIAILSFWVLGAAILSQSNNALFGIRADALIGWSGISVKWISYLSLVLIATAILAPAVSERSRLRVPLVLGAILAGLLVPLTFFWTHRGWLLDQLGFIDDAGAAAIHLVPALAAWAAALFIGARDGKYNRDKSANMIPGHSIPLILSGTLLCFVGWLPYVFSASSEPRIESAANVCIAAAAGGFVAMMSGYLRYRKADILLTVGGLMGGLVSITATADRIGTPAAFLTGAVAGLLVPWVTVFIDLTFHLDDPGAVVATHGAGAIWALMSAAIFVPGTMVEHFHRAGVQALGIVVIAITTLAVVLAALMALRIFGSLRAKEADEYDGLDLAEHDINAHPDFQQTTIKSYHLREA